MLAVLFIHSSNPMTSGRIVHLMLLVVAHEHTTNTTADGPAGGQHARMYIL